MSVSMSLNLPPLCDPQIEALFHSQSIQKGSTTKKKILLCEESYVHASEVSEGKTISTN